MAVPIWVKQGVDVWMTAAGIVEGKLLRPVLKGSRLVGDELSDWAVWSVVEQSADRHRTLWRPRLEANLC